MNPEELKKLAETIETLGKNYGAHAGLIADLKKQVELGAGMEALKALNEKVEKLAVDGESIRKAIASQKNTMYISGVEDYVGKFSMLRAIGVVHSAKLRTEKSHGLEWEIIKQVKEKAANTAIDAEGGYFVPDQVIPEVIEGIYRASRFVALGADGSTRCSVINGLTGGKVSIPKFEKGAIAYWVGEEDAYAESAAKTGMLTMSPKKLGVLVRLTDEMRKFAAYGFESLLRNDMIRAAAAKLDETVPYGAGTDNAPRGIYNTPGVNQFSAQSNKIYDSAVVTDAQGKTINFDLLTEMMGVLEDNNIGVDSDFAFMMSPKAIRALKRQKVSHFSGQTDEKSYTLSAPVISDATLSSLIGAYDKTTVLKNTQKPGQSLGWATTSTNANATDIVAANWNNVLVGRWGGIEIVTGQTDNDFIKDASHVKLRLWADVGHRHAAGVIVCPDALVA